jgi:hypothetical protein
MRLHPTAQSLFARRVQSEVGTTVGLKQVSRDSDESEVACEEGGETAPNCRRAGLSGGEVSAYIASVQASFRFADIQRLVVENGDEGELRPRRGVTVKA